MWKQHEITGGGLDGRERSFRVIVYHVTAEEEKSQAERRRVTWIEDSPAKFGSLNIYFHLTCMSAGELSELSREVFPRREKTSVFHPLGNQLGCSSHEGCLADATTLWSEPVTTVVALTTRLERAHVQVEILNMHSVWVQLQSPSLPETNLWSGVGLSVWISVSECFLECSGECGGAGWFTLESPVITPQTQTAILTLTARN